MNEKIDPTQPPPFSIGGPIGQKPNTEPLNGKYKQAYEFAMNDHLQAKQDLDAAKQENEELRFRLTDAQVKIEAMDSFNKLLEDRLDIADIDRKRAIDERAECAVRLDMLRKLLEKPPETLG